MKDYTFYLEYPTLKDKRKATRKELGNHSGTVLAVYGDWFNIGHYYKKECVSSVYDKPNSDVCCSSCDSGYLNDKCKRISDKQAREIHPKLFQYLDED